MDNRLIHPSSFGTAAAAARANSEAVNNTGNEAMYATMRSTGKSIKTDELVEKIVETAKVTNDPSDTLGKAAKQMEFYHTTASIEMPDPTEKEKDRENDPRYNEKTGMPLPYGREQNYLALRSRIGRRRR